MDMGDGCADTSQEAESPWPECCTMAWSSTMTVSSLPPPYPSRAHLPPLGTPSTTSQMAKDVVTFLAWTAEPELDERKKMGLQAVVILSTMTAISLYVKRAKWVGLKNRKICESAPGSCEEGAGIGRLMVVYDANRLLPTQVSLDSRGV